ncbi:MAG TPA: hypothetical protein VHS57_03660 [Acidimicrobiales bacterium]|nr:hypothetical protein [Acidimicrobiales bacterium]
MAEPAGDVAPSLAAHWRTIDELAALVGAYCWLERRLFELAGGWAASRGDGGLEAPVDAGAAACRVWCAAASRRHGLLAGRWAERLPVRAGVDAAAFVTPPGGPLAAALEGWTGAAPRAGLGLLVETLLPWVAGLYASHLARATPASEAPVVEVLVEARRAAAGEIRGGQSLLQRQPGGETPSRHEREPVERALARSDVFPAVRAS